MIKAVFFDIDGTLLQPISHKMPDSTLKALQMLRFNGIKVFVATGRPPTNIEIIKKYFNFDGYLTCNGQYCFNEQGVIHESYIDSDDIKKILRYSREKNIPVLFAELTRVYSNMKNHILDQSADYLKEPRYPVLKDEEIIGQKIVQMMAYMDEIEDVGFLQVASHCKSARWTDIFADIIPDNGGKDIGIKRVLDYYQISIQESMAFGDGGNDISMLTTVGLGVAMGNANEKVQKASDFVTKSVDEDGIYYALKYFNVI